jgi:hypothetical protein
LLGIVCFSLYVLLTVCPIFSPRHAVLVHEEKESIPNVTCRQNGFYTVYTTYFHKYILTSYDMEEIFNKLPYSLRINWLHVTLWGAQNTSDMFCKTLIYAMFFQSYTVGNLFGMHNVHKGLCVKSKSKRQSICQGLHSIGDITMWVS